MLVSIRLVCPNQRPELSLTGKRMQLRQVNCKLQWEVLKGLAIYFSCLFLTLWRALSQITCIVLYLELSGSLSVSGLTLFIISVPGILGGTCKLSTQDCCPLSLPKEISHAPRSFSERRFWKATEYKSCCPVVLFFLCVNWSAASWILLSLVFICVFHAFFTTDWSHQKHDRKIRFNVKNSCDSNWGTVRKRVCLL